MRIAYVLGTFPKLSETFILREIEELERQGVEIHQFALERPEEILDERGSTLAARTWYAPTVTMPDFWLADSYYFITQFRLSMSQLGRLSRDVFPNFLRGVKHLYWNSVARALAREMQRRQIQVVHAHFAGLPAFAGLIAAELVGAKFSFSGHAQDIFVRPELLQWKAETAGLIVACSEAGRHRLLELLPLALHPRVHLVHHGVARGEGLPKRAAVEGGPPCILSVGRLEEKKGFPDLLMAAKDLKERGVEFRLEIIGEGSKRAELVQQSEKMGLRGRVEFLGARPNAEVVNRMRAARIFALASRQTLKGDRDGIPNVLLEAAAAGVPIVATSTGGIPELIRHEVSGMLSKPGNPDELADNIRRVLEDESLQERLRDGARQEIERAFDLSSNVATLRGLFERLAGSE